MLNVGMNIFYLRALRLLVLYFIVLFKKSYWYLAINYKNSLYIFDKWTSR